jgi:hypothetical protein
MSFQCLTCPKVLSSNNRLKNHTKICKGVENTLTCYKCFEIFNNFTSKYNHLKKCYAVQPPPGHYLLLRNEINIINNINNNTQNIIINNNIINNYNYHNQNLIEESDDEKYTEIDINDFGSEKIDYITDNELTTLALNLNIRELIEKIYFNEDHPENQNIRKGNKNYFLILKNKKWKLETKEEIINKIFNNCKGKLYSHSIDYIFYKKFNDSDTAEYINRWMNYEKLNKKRIDKYTEMKCFEIFSNRKKEQKLLN